MNRFGHYVYEPVWRRKAHLFNQCPPEAMANWLFDPGSLTQRLIQTCTGQLNVRVIFQAWERPMLNEAVRLAVPYNRLALVREVYLFCDDLPWVFARTVIPVTTLTGPRRHLASLGSKPLGAVLFADPSMQRDEIEVACIQKGQQIYNSASRVLSSQPASIWGRRSVFYLAKKPLLVNEIFLPEIVKYT